MQTSTLLAIELLNPTVLGKPTPTGCEKDSDLFYLLSNYQHTKEAINNATDKKKLTCLGCAVETGRPDIVSKLITMNVVVDQIYSLDAMTPLYKAVQNHSCRGKPQFSNALKRMEYSGEMLEGIRRSTPTLSGMTLDDTRAYLESRRNDGDYQSFMKPAADELDRRTMAVYQAEALLEIIEILLKAGANPNGPKSKNKTVLPDFSPLMLAAELNNLEAFKLLIKYGGDPELTFQFPGTNECVNCMAIAAGHGAAHIIRFLDNSTERL